MTTSASAAPLKMRATIAQSMLAEFEHELATTQRFLERVPEDPAKLNWRPHEKSMTLGELALHIAQVPMGVLGASMQDEMKPPDFSTREKPSSRAHILQNLEQCASFVRANLPKISDERMEQNFKVVNNGNVVMALPRVAFLRRIMLNHWYHHRGQLGVYLRLLGVKVPFSYGPSADESPF